SSRTTSSQRSTRPASRATRSTYSRRWSSPSTCSSMPGCSERDALPARTDVEAKTEAILDGDGAAEERHRPQSEIALVDREASTGFEDVATRGHRHVERNDACHAVERDRHVHPGRWVRG